MRYKQLTLLFLVVFINIKGFSAPDTLIVNTDDSAQKIGRDLDSLVNTWYVKIALKQNLGEYHGDTALLQCPDSVYENRISRINSIIFLPFKQGFMR